MFTGLVEEIGTINSIKKSGKTLTIFIQAKQILEDIHLGDSIAVNGVCLTVTSYKANVFSMDVMPTTFYDTTLHQLQEGMKVNLERAMSANGRFGGHFVSGHVDCVGTIIGRLKVENSIVLEVKFPIEYSHLIMEKGSITIDGTSLTIFKTTDTSFCISLIPHTASVSMIGQKVVGNEVNLEFDLLAKYFDSFMNKKHVLPTKKESAVTSAFLKENGFY